MQKYSYYIKFLFYIYCIFSVNILKLKDVSENFFFCFFGKFQGLKEMFQTILETLEAVEYHRRYSLDLVLDVCRRKDVNQSEGDLPEGKPIRGKILSYTHQNQININYNLQHPKNIF